MKKQVTQKNKEGYNIGEDNIEGDKIVQSIVGKVVGENAVMSIHIENLTSSNIRLKPEDEKEFGECVPGDRILEYKNLINRTAFNCELGQYYEAKKYIEKANEICHNHHIMLSYNALCEYATSNTVHLITKDFLIEKIVHLFSKARKLDDKSWYYQTFAHSIAAHFFNSLKEYIDETVKIGSSGISRRTRRVQYYMAIGQYLIHLENCFRIWNNTEYIKEYILHLSGNKGYPWINISNQGNLMDLGLEIFEGGAMKKLEQLISTVKELEPNYIPPEIKYGNYFENPTDKNSLMRNQRKVIIKTTILILISLVIFSSLFAITKMPLYFSISIFIALLIIWGLSHPFGSEKYSVFQRLSLLIMEYIDN